MNVPLWSLPLTPDTRKTCLEAVLHSLCGVLDDGLARTYADVRDACQKRCDRLSLSRLEWAFVNDAVSCWQVADAEQGVDRERVRRAQAFLDALEAVLREEATAVRAEPDKAAEVVVGAQGSLF